MSPASHTSIGSSNSNVTYWSDLSDPSDSSGDDPWEGDEFALQHGRAVLIIRACRAYLRYSPYEEEGNYAELPSEAFSHTCCDEKTQRGYVCLGGATGRLLAVFRIDSREKLKRLRRYPAFVIKLFGKEQSSLRLPAVKHKKSVEGGIKLKLDPALMASYRKAMRQYKIGIA
jgi:hypothetical protein